MAATSSVSGLVSGLDTASIISQLMQVESQPQTLLKTQMTTDQKVVTALQAINSKLAGIATKAADLAKVANWSPTTATSSNDKVTVTADPGVVPASLSFSVDQLAASASTTYAMAATSDTVVVAPNTQLTIAFADTSKTNVTVATGDGKLSTLVSALNASGMGVDAVLVRAGMSGTQPTYQLSVASQASGLLSGFTITTADGSQFLDGSASSAPGADAKIMLAGESTQRSFSTNDIADLMPGVDVVLTAGSVGSSTTITVARDVKGMSDTVKALVDAVNSVLSDVDTQTAYNADTKTSGTLAGESSVRALRDQLVSAVSMGLGGKSFADVGIQLDRDGKLVFDETKFQAAYANDPSGVTSKFVDATAPSPAGLASTLAGIAKSLSDPIQGTLTLSIQMHNADIKSEQDAISDWDVRLQQKQDDLQRQFSAMEVALGQLQNQASWLSGQIASLPTTSS